MTEKAAATKTTWWTLGYLDDNQKEVVLWRDLGRDGPEGDRNPVTTVPFDRVHDLTGLRQAQERFAREGVTCEVDGSGMQILSWRKD